ncbi:hypothetical protein ACUY4R_001927 [Kosakonia sp. BK9b]
MNKLWGLPLFIFAEGCGFFSYSVGFKNKKASEHFLPLRSSLGRDREVSPLHRIAAVGIWKGGRGTTMKEWHCAIIDADRIHSHRHQRVKDILRP